MRNNYNTSENVRSAWFTELKEKYPTIWDYGKKNSKSNRKGKNASIVKVVKRVH